MLRPLRPYGRHAHLAVLVMPKLWRHFETDSGCPAHLITAGELPPDQQCTAMIVLLTAQAVQRVHELRVADLIAKALTQQKVERVL